MQSRLLLDIVVGQRTPILELFASEDQALLVGWDALLVLNLCLDVIDRVGGLDLQRDCLASERLDEYLHTSTETENEMESRLFLNIVVRESTTVLELLPGEDKTLLVGGDTFLVLDLGLHIIDCVRRLDFQRDGLTRKGLDEYLHAATEAEN